MLRLEHHPSERAVREVSCSCLKRNGPWEFKLAPLVLIKDGVYYVIMVNSWVRNTESIRTSSSHGWGKVHLPVNMGDKVSHGVITSQVNTRYWGGMG